MAQTVATLEHRNLLESVILDLGDIFEIRIVWDRETAVYAGAFAVAGGLLGGYVGGRLGATLGAGLGSATGLGVSTLVTLREVWEKVKEKLVELLFVVFNFLRRLHPVDYVAAAEILMASRSSRRELALTMLELIAQKLDRNVISSLTVA